MKIDTAGWLEVCYDLQTQLMLKFLLICGEEHRVLLFFRHGGRVKVFFHPGHEGFVHVEVMILAGDRAWSMVTESSRLFVILLELFDNFEAITSLFIFAERKNVIKLFAK